jgi:hypothetical protein
LPAEKPDSKRWRGKSNQLQQSVMLAQNISACGNLFGENCAPHFFLTATENFCQVAKI